MSVPDPQRNSADYVTTPFHRRLRKLASPGLIQINVRVLNTNMLLSEEQSV
jgi:hypothetical protein